jgi:urea carboxylase-associated protein 2
MTWRPDGGGFGNRSATRRAQERHERRLADPLAARDHRAPWAAQSGSDAGASAGRRRPPRRCSRDDLLWEEVVAAGGYATRRLARGTRLRLIDLRGDACASLMVFNAEMPTERLNVADTVKVQWNAYLGAGKLLLSDMGRVLMSIIEDDAGTHDAFCGTSNAATNSARYGEGRNSGAFPTGATACCWARRSTALAAATSPCINLFKGTRIEADGAITPLVGPYDPGRTVLLRAEMDVIVVIANCPHVLDPRPDWTVTPLRLSAWRGPATPPDDAIRNATPEGLRAFLNVEIITAASKEFASMSDDPHTTGLPGTIVHDEIVPSRAPWLHHVAAGQTLRIVDLEGNQAVDFLLYATADDAERYSAQDTVAAQGNLFLREGTVLRSNEGRPMMVITGTSVDYHDTIGGACSCESNTLRYGHHQGAARLRRELP